MLITHVKQLTPSVLTGILRFQGFLDDSGVVSSLRVIKTEETDDSMTHQIAVRYEKVHSVKTSPLSLFLKISKRDFPNADHEILFYTEMAPKMYAKHNSKVLPLPYCYDGYYDPDVGRSHLLIDNLAKNYFGAKAGSPPSERHYTLVMEGLAHMHAYWWENADLAQYVQPPVYEGDQPITTTAPPEAPETQAETPDTSTEDSADAQNPEDAEAVPTVNNLAATPEAPKTPPDEPIITTAMLDAQFEAIQAQYAAFLKPMQFKLTARHREIMDVITQRLPTQRRQDWLAGKRVTLVHGDNSPENFLYAFDNIKLIDWQRWGAGTGTDDVAYFIMAFASDVVRKFQERNLVQRYWDTLRSLGVKNYSWEQCWQDYRASAGQAVLRVLMTWEPSLSQGVYWKRGERALKAFDELKAMELYD